MIRKKRMPPKGLIYNVFYSAASIVLSVGFMQFVLMPLISRSMEEEEYGFMLTLISVVNVFAVTFGGTLGSIRLIKKEKYNKGPVGDFNVLGIVYSILGCVLSILGCYLFGEKSGFILLLIGVYSVVVFYNSYGAVFFRLKKKFVLEFISSGLMILGYLLGFLIFRATGIWHFIFIIGYSLGFLFSGIIYGQFYKEPFVRTEFFQETNKDIVQLNISTLLKEMVSYTDKMFLFSMMGGATVAIYNAAAIVGKCVALVTNPINGLALSYLSNDESKNRRYLQLGWLFSCIVAVVLYFVFLLISRPILYILYPQYCERAMEIIPLTLAAAMINAMVAMINPFILKALSPKIQIYMNLSSLVVYSVLAYFLYKLWGVEGFCLAIILSSVVKLGFLGFGTRKINRFAEEHTT